MLMVSVGLCPSQLWSVLISRRRTVFTLNFNLNLPWEFVDLGSPDPSYLPCSQFPFIRERLVRDKTKSHPFSRLDSYTEIYFLKH